MSSGPKPRYTPAPARTSLEELERRLDIILGLHTPWSRYGEIQCLACHNLHPCDTVRAAPGEPVRKRP